MRQILPVVKRGTIEESVNMSIKCSWLWKQAFQRRSLTHNMRIFGQSGGNYRRSCEWDAYLKCLGTGLFTTPEHIGTHFRNFNSDRDTYVNIPASWELLPDPIIEAYTSTHEFIDEVFKHEDLYNPKTTILCPTNKMVPYIKMLLYFLHFMLISS